MKQIPIPLPPLDYQLTIVAEIDTQLSRLDETVSTLQGIQAKLKQARASILKAAVEGGSVETEAQLSKQTGDSFLSAKDLLSEARAFIPIKNSGRSGKTNNPDLTNKIDLVEFDGEILPQLPDEWSWATMERIAKTVRNGFSGKPSEQGPVKILRISAVRALSVNYTDTRSLPGCIKDYASAVATKGCLLITRYNGNPDLVGVMGHYHSRESVVHPDKLIRIELASDMIKPEWIEVAFNTGITRALLRKRVRTTAGQAGISGQDVKAMPIPIPPTAEQIRITQELKRRFSVLDQVEATVQASLQRCGILRQAILKRAFEGPVPTRRDG